MIAMVRKPKLGVEIRSRGRRNILLTAPDGSGERYSASDLLSRVVRGGCVSLPDNSVRLGSFLPLDDIELNVIALFQSLVTIQLDCRVVNENIWSVFTSDESVALGVIEPLHLAFVLSHRVLPFLPLEEVSERMFWGTAHLTDYDAYLRPKVYLKVTRTFTK
jgi:hypothetical protein